MGGGHAALAMYMEILHSIHGEAFQSEIIRNMQFEDPTPFRVAGASCVETFYTDWQRPESASFILGVNKPESKAIVQHFFQQHFGVKASDYMQLIDPGATIASTASLAAGVVVNPGVVIAAYARLGEMASINRSVSVGHHTSIGAFSTIQPGVDIAGKCTIGNGVTIGMGANVIDGITIGDNATIGAGALVTKDIPANVVAYGVPATVIREKKGKV